MFVEHTFVLILIRSSNHTKYYTFIIRCINVEPIHTCAALTTPSHSSILCDCQIATSNKIQSEYSVFNHHLALVCSIFTTCSFQFSFRIKYKKFWCGRVLVIRQNKNRGNLYFWKKKEVIPEIMNLSIYYIGSLFLVCHFVAATEFTFDLVDNAEECFHEIINKDVACILEFQVFQVFFQPKMEQK